MQKTSGTGAIILLLVLSPVPAADRIYKWQDADGQLHYSDSVPEHIAGHANRIKIKSATGGQGGLRQGELQTLREMNQRTARQQATARITRRNNDLRVTAKKKLCDDYRDKMQANRGSGKYKIYSRYLQKNCW